jgi:hypothetical protein
VQASATANERRPLPLMRALLAAFSVLTLLAVLTLFVLSERTDRLFAWTIKPPVTAAFLGAGYGAGLVLVLLSLRESRWSRIRIPALTILTFTVLTLIATLLHLDRFHFSGSGHLAAFAAWFWTAIYIAVPLIMLVLLWPQERVPGSEPPPGRPVPRTIRIPLAGQALVMLGLGTALFFAPGSARTLWPWNLTPLTARVTAAWLLAFGLSAVAASVFGDLDRLRTSTVAYTVFGLLELVVLVRYRGVVQWDRWSAWVLAGLLAAVALTGAAGWRETLRVPEPTGAAATDVADIADVAS